MYIFFSGIFGLNASTKRVHTERSQRFALDTVIPRIGGAARTLRRVRRGAARPPARFPGIAATVSGIVQVRTEALRLGAAYAHSAGSRDETIG